MNEGSSSDLRIEILVKNIQFFFIIFTSFCGLQFLLKTQMSSNLFSVLNALKKERKSQTFPCRRAEFHMNIQQNVMDLVSPHCQSLLDEQIYKVEEEKKSLLMLPSDLSATEQHATHTHTVCKCVCCSLRPITELPQHAPTAHVQASATQTGWPSRQL